MKKWKLFYLLFALLHFITATSQNEMMAITNNETATIDSIVTSNMKAWVEAVTFLLTTDFKSKGRYFKTEEESDAFLSKTEQKYECYNTFKIFMCNDDDDDTVVKDSNGNKRSILPTITVVFKDVASGKSTTQKKTIRNLKKFLEKSKYSVDHIDVTNIQVYLVDDVKKLNLQDGIGKFVCYVEHVFSLADYQFDDGKYKLTNLQNDSFFINRGKSYWGQNRNEEKLIQQDNVVVIIGDVSLNVYYK